MHNLNLSLEQINLIISALAELPAKVSYELITEVRKQTLEQVEECSLK